MQSTTVLFWKFMVPSYPCTAAGSRGQGASPQRRYYPPRLDPHHPDAPVPGEPAAPGTPTAPPPPPFEKSGLLFYALLFALLLPDAIAQRSDRTLGLAWSLVFIFLLPALVAAAGSNLQPLRYLGLSRPRAAPVVLGALAGGAGFLVANGIMALWIRIVPRGWLERFDVGSLFQVPLPEQIAIALVASLLAPFCEEVAFRGYLQRTLAIRWGPAVGISAAAVLFAARHLDPVRFPALVLLGGLFGWLSWRSGSLWPAVSAHATNNALVSALALSARSPDALAEPPPLDAVLHTLAVGGVALALLLWAGRRATPTPPAPASAVARRHPDDPSLRFRPWLVPAPLVLAMALGFALLAALVAKGPGR
jgi:membrane protease YdiL (CAAX protease family)